ncbi:MAG: hypothetical protein FJ295_01395 [Planctomycetes bacterium]|nr:hypothetical protein [Planctomycetota bacterium]
MQFVDCWMCVWPGLPWIWLQGQIRGLLTALSFALLLNLALVTTFVWPEWLPFLPRSAFWIGLLGFWSVSAWNSHRYLKAQARLPKSRPLSAVAETTPARTEEKEREQADRLLEQAVQRYLQRQWPEAESGLRQIADGAGADDAKLFARLTLAALYRRTGRPDLSYQELDHLAGMPGNGKWEYEVQRERSRLNLPAGDAVHGLE